MLHLQFKQLRIGEHIATTTIQAFFFIGLDHATHFGYQVLMHSNSLLIVISKLEIFVSSRYPINATLYPLTATELVGPLFTSAAQLSQIRQPGGSSVRSPLEPAGRGGCFQSDA
jgi:hypothetical protein